MLTALEKWVGSVAVLVVELLSKVSVRFSGPSVGAHRLPVDASLEVAVLVVDLELLRLCLMRRLLVVAVVLAVGLAHL